MDTLQSMRALTRVVEAGSFTAAAASMNTTTGAVSRAVSELETHLRTRLLTRSTRKLSLTPAGERYLLRCRQILADIDQAEEEASNAHEHPSGTLRIFSFASIGQHYVLPAIGQYRARHPDVKVDLTLAQQTPDLFEGSIDVAVVGASALPDADIVSHLLGSTFSILCASPGYLQQHGAPATPADLLSHECLTLNTPAFPANDWTMEGPDGAVALHIEGPVQVNIAESLRAAVLEGMGIGMLPLYSAVSGLRDGSLVRVLPSYTLQSMNVYALYPSRKFLDAKTRTWVAFLREHLPEVIERDKAFLAPGGRAQADTTAHAASAAAVSTPTSVALTSTGTGTSTIAGM